MTGAELALCWVLLMLRCEWAYRERGRWSAEEREAGEAADVFRFAAWPEIARW